MLAASNFYTCNQIKTQTSPSITILIVSEIISVAFFFKLKASFFKKKLKANS